MAMKFPKCVLQFYVSDLADIRFLLQAWDGQLRREGQHPSWDVLVYVLVEHRFPGEEVYLNFTAPPEVMGRFLARLRAEGLSFSCNEIIPGFLTMCRVEHECF